MISFGKFISLIYNKFGSEQIGKCRDVIRDIIENEFEQSMFDDYIDCSEFPSKEIMFFIASALEADGQKEKAKWLRIKAQERPDKKESEVKFYWLNNRIETEIQTMQKSQRTHLKQTIDEILENPGKSWKIKRKSSKHRICYKRS